MGKQPAGPAPGVEHDSFRELLAFSGDHHAIVFAQRSGAGGAPVQFQCGEAEPAQLVHQIARPLVTEPALPDAGVHEEIVELWRTHHAVFAAKLARLLVSPNGDALRLVVPNSR